jgi:ribonuclease D
MKPAAQEADWIATHDELFAVVQELLLQPAYAIDTEFHREKTYFPHLALVQIYWPGRTVLIDPLAIDITPLRALFESEVLAVFHAMDQDLEVLEHVVGAVPKVLFDTQVAAGFVGFSTPSLSSLVERVLHIQLSKGDRLTDWTQRPLTNAQKNYAALDVVYLLELRDRLNEQLTISGRAEWLEEELNILRRRQKGPHVAEQAWWRLKDGRVLRGKDRLVAQEICAWRERRARVEDRPVRFILPDLAVLALAQSRPTELDQLANMRGLDGRYLKSGAGRELLAVVEDASARPLSDLHVQEVEDFDKRLRPAQALVSAWVAQLARDAKIEPSLLATRHDLIQFLRGDADSRLGKGWRADILGTAVRQLVDGEAALVFNPKGELLLEKRSGVELVIELAKPTADWIVDAPDHRSDD